eukprot:497179-Pelagomonas_calceolata.AAC.1
MLTAGNEELPGGRLETTLACVAFQSKQQPEKGRHIVSQTQPRQKAGRQAKHQEKIRAALLQERSGNNTMARAKLSQRRSARSPKRGKDGGLLARAAIRTGHSAQLPARTLAGQSTGCSWYWGPKNVAC